ncbi:MAG TPA: dTDP-glucose 4,6-dehydratase [Clostridia bacterium]
MLFFITGGAGFIGSNFLNMFVPRYPEHTFINIDNLSYAANLKNLDKIKSCSNYIFENIDITDFENLKKAFSRYTPDVIVHFAAETHVDRSIASPESFINTNVAGTFNLLELSRIHFGRSSKKLFHHVSTDEVYGSLDETGYFTEGSAYSPRSPYSASKAASDHLVKAYYHTYGLQVTLTNCSNNYGPYQFPEKLIPLAINNLLNNMPIPVYGDGMNIRDWLYVEDHCEAIWTVIEKGLRGETYNVGGSCEKTNLDLINSLCSAIAEITGKPKDRYKELITFVKDRPGHDRRYAIDSSKLQNELGWKPKLSFDEGLKKTAMWYINNPEWLKSTCTDEYSGWINTNYVNRG